MQQLRRGELLAGLQAAGAHAAEAVEVPGCRHLLAAADRAEDGQRERRLRAEQVQLLPGVGLDPPLDLVRQVVRGPPEGGGTPL